MSLRDILAKDLPAVPPIKPAINKSIKQYPFRPKIHQSLTEAANLPKDNNKEFDNPRNLALKMPGMNHSPRSLAAEILAKKLTYKNRQALPDHAFCIVKKIDGKKVRKYPLYEMKGGQAVPSLSHGRNALSRVSGFGTPEEKDIVRRKVYKLFPELKDSAKARGTYKSAASDEIRNQPVTAAIRMKVNALPKMLRHIGYRPQRREILYHDNNTQISTVFASSDRPDMDTLDRLFESLSFQKIPTAIPNVKSWNSSAADIGQFTLSTLPGDKGHILTYIVMAPPSSL